MEEASVPFWGENVFGQDNFPNSRGGGATGFDGHRVQIDIQPAENVSFDVRAYLLEGKETNDLAFSEVAGRTIHRTQVNANARF